MRWLLVIGSGSLASKSSRLPPSQPSFARGRAPSNSTTPKSSSHWSSRRLGRHLGSWRPHTRPRSPTCSCNVVDDWVTRTYLLVVYCQILFEEFSTIVFGLIFVFLLDAFWWSFWYLSRMKQIYNLITAEYRLDVLIDSSPITVYSFFLPNKSKITQIVYVGNVLPLNILNFEYSFVNLAF